MTTWQHWASGHPVTPHAGNVCWNRTNTGHDGQGSKPRESAVSTGAEHGTGHIDLEERQLSPGHSHNHTICSGANRKREVSQGRSNDATRVANNMNTPYRFGATTSCLTKKTGAPTPVLFEVHCL